MSASMFPLSTLDQQALALLVSLKNNSEVQKDQALFKIFSDAVFYITPSTNSSTIPLSISSSRVTGMTEIVSAPASESSSLVPFLQIDTSGGDGDNGFPGTSGSSFGLRGLNGTDGVHGKDANGIHLQLSIVDGAVVAQWDNNIVHMKLGDESASIFLRAIGGNGGRGGNGGNGGAGATGERGKDATRYSNGTNGGKGKPGGAGGNGGDGGNGGKGGDVKVYVGPQDSDLLMLLKTLVLTGGNTGKGGAKGKGGSGGKGGQGGSSYTWTQLIVNPPNRFNQTTTHVCSYTNRGGSNGSQGLDGDDGRMGDDGKQGVNGSFQMIEGRSAYQTLYNLVVSVSKIIDLKKGNPADIYEPGELVNLMVTATNTGGMPTPSQDIDISLLRTSWIESENASLTLKANEHLSIGGCHIFSTPFSFRVKDQLSSTEEPLNKQETLGYHALLRRVNKSFSSISQQKDLFSVRYPVQISPLTGKVITSFEKKLSLALSIQNIASNSIGKAGSQKRRVFVTFDVLEGKNLLETYQKTVEVDQLSPKSEEKINITFLFTGVDRQIRSKVSAIASLHLDYFNSESDQVLGPRCIQKRSLQIELEEEAWDVKI